MILFKIHLENEMRNVLFFFLIPLLHKERSLLNHQYNSYKGAVEVRGGFSPEKKHFFPMYQF